MKINFQSFELVTDIKGERVETTDLREVVADVIYKNAVGVKALDLAMKIYKSEGETEYGDDDVKMLSNIVNAQFNGMMIRSFRRAIGEEV